MRNVDGAPIPLTSEEALRTAAARLLTIAITLGCLAPLGVSVSAPQVDQLGAYPVHISIDIEGDAAFASSDAVRSGHGTLEDPYVISGWTILHTASAALRLHGTRAHVIIERIDTRVDEQPVLSDASCTPMTDLTLDCEGSRGVDLTDAQNVTVRDVTLLNERYSIYLNDARSIEIAHAVLGKVASPRSLGGSFWVLDSADVEAHDVLLPYGGLATGVYRSSDITLDAFHIGQMVGSADISEGIEMQYDHNVTVSNATIRASGVPPHLYWVDSEGLTLRDSVLLNATEDEQVPIANITGLTLERDRFEGVRILGSKGGSHWRVVGNDFANSSIGFEYSSAGPTGGPQATDMLLCGNDLHGSSFAALHIEGTYDRAGGVSGLRIINNTFHDNFRNALVDLNLDVHVQANTFLASGRPDHVGATFDNWGETDHENSFLDPSGVAIAGRNATVPDATSNWYGDASGPSGIGPGAGTPLWGGSGSFASPTYSPWLTAPPLPVACPTD